MLLHPIRQGVISGRGGASLHNVDPQFSLIIPKDFIGILRKLQLTTNLKLCLDAGDASSYDPGVQTDKWLDRAGSGYDFFRGSGTGADAADPTFNGSAGGLSSAEYWGHDGGDYFTYDTANEAWMENIHKDNAIATVAGWVYIASSGIVGLCGGGGNSATNVGISFRVVPTSRVLRLRVFNGSGTVALDVTGALAGNNDAWNFVAMSINEATGAGGLLYFVNGSTETNTSTYSSPSAAGSSFTWQIGATGNAQQITAANSRKGGMVILEGTALTAAQLAAIYLATRGRYGV